jgi:hypothetical protein
MAYKGYRRRPPPLMGGPVYWDHSANAVSYAPTDQDIFIGFAVADSHTHPDGTETVLVQLNGPADPTSAK